MVLLAAGVAYVSGVVFFGGNAYEDHEDGLILDLDLTQNNYDSGTKTFTDDSGEGNDGVSLNVASFTPDKDGKSTGAMSFDGSSDYVSLPALPLVENISASVWVYPINIGLNTGLWAMMLSSGSSPNRFYFSAYNNKLQANIGPAILYSNTAYNNKWYLMTVTYNNVTKNASLYVDGVYTSSALTNLTIYSSFKIGSYVGGGYPFNGSISQVKIYNRSLSATEVMALYNSSKPKASGSSLNKGLIGHWELDSESYNSATDRVADKTPYSNHGVNYGATLTTDQMGQSNRAMSFDGSADYINILDDASLSFGDDSSDSPFSISAWVYLTGLDDISKRIVAKDDEWIFGTCGVGTLSFTIYDLVVSGANAYTFSDDTYENLIGFNNWAHVVATYNASGDATGLTLYVNGENIAQTRNTQAYTAMHDLSNPVTIGRFNYDYNYWNGSISDVRIYNRALNADDVDTLYHSYRPKAASGSLYKGLVLDMPLTSTYAVGSAGSELIKDRTPYSNNGQNYGASVGSDYIDFDGTSSNYIDVGDNLVVENGIFSVSLWAYSTDLNAGTMISRWDTGAHPGNNSWGLSHNGGVGALYFSIEENDNGIVSSTTSFTNDIWHHIVGVANGTKIYLYVDNVLKDSDDYDGTMNQGLQTKLLIGRLSPSVNWYGFKGFMSSAKIYNRALSESEIKLLYDKGR